MGGLFGGGLLGGFAQSYAEGARRDLEDKLAQRKQLGDLWLGIATHPGVRPEAQTTAVKNLVGLGGLDPHAKIPKQFSDFNAVLTPPPGSNQPGQPTQMPGFDIGSQLAPPPQGFGDMGQGPGAALSGGASPGMGAPHGTGLPMPSASFAPPQFNMTSTPNTGPPIASFGAPPPPAYSPFYSPEELNQQAAQRAGEATGAQLQAQIGIRERLIKEHPDWNFQQIELAMGQRPESMFLGNTLSIKGPKGEKIPAFRGRYDTNIYDKDGNIIQNPELWTSADEADTVWKATLKSHDGNVAAALKDYNTTQSQRSGFTIQQQADGSTRLIPYQEGTTTTRGGEAPPAPPVSKITGPGTEVGYKVPEPVQKAFSAVNDAESRYQTMTESLPSALAGDQQAMVNLLGAHIGMTVQGNSIRGTQSVWNEAAASTPWLEKALARWTNTDPNTGEVTITLDPKAGAFLTAPQMKSMVQLGKQRVDVADKAYDRMRAETRKGYGMQKQAAPENKTPATHQWSKSAWKKANPNGDATAAEKAAEAAHYEVVP